MLQGALGPKTQNLKYAQAGVPAPNLMPCPNSGAALRPAQLDSGHPGFNPSGGNMGPNDPWGAARRFFDIPARVPCGFEPHSMHIAARGVGAGL